MPHSAQGTRINKYLADHKYCTRKEADELIRQGRVSINGRRAALGERVAAGDDVQVRLPRKTLRYFAYHKPVGLVTHSAQQDETEILDTIDLHGVFPVGRLDKDSSGLIILTDDGRLTGALLSPTHEHEKEYQVHTALPLPRNFKRRLERGIDIGGYVTKPCRVAMRGEKSFSIILTEGKKRQIRRMCGALGAAVASLKRVRICNIKLGNLQKGAFRQIDGTELQTFLQALDLQR